MSNYLELINKGQKYSPEYKIGDIEGISSHLPMCLYARHKLGASNEQLTKFYDNYIKQLVIKEPQPENTFDWKKNLGCHKYTIEYVNFFKQLVEREGVEKVLHDFLPTLFKGVGGAAFHPLIRLSYALEMENESEVIEALASWGMGYLELNGEISTTELKPVEVIENLSKLKISDVDISAPSVYLRMRKANGLECFSREVKYPKNINLEDIAKVALDIFLSNQNFSTLHLVTATHALRIVSPYLLNQEEAFKCYWAALTSVYIAVKAPEIKIPNTDCALLSWEELAEKAVASDNDHWCKFVYTCNAENLVYESSKYLLAANLLLGEN